MRLPDAACLVRVRSRTEMKDRCRFDTRYYVSSAALTAKPCGATGPLRTACTGCSTWCLRLPRIDSGSIPPQKLHVEDGRVVDEAASVG